MRRGKHAPKHIRTRANPNVPHNISRLGVHAKCQVVLNRGHTCSIDAAFYGRAVRPTRPPTPRHELFLCKNHASDMRDLYGYEVHLLTGQYALLA